MRTIRASAWALALVCLVSAGERTAAADDTLTVLYTGKLLGYARMPDRQPRVGGASGCAVPPAGTPEDGTEIALTLKNRLHAVRGALIVGMGDNFAPELDARRFTDGTLKELYTWDYMPGGRGWLENTPANQKPLLAGL